MIIPFVNLNKMRPFSIFLSATENIGKKAVMSQYWTHTLYEASMLL